jgi:exodeoxyribonuclease-3
VKIGTWNVNGIRAREAQVGEFIAREGPDVVCLQEIKAPPSKVPPSLCALEGYWCLWHGETAYSGVALLVRKAIAPERPAFVHPPFDLETRIATCELGGVTVASIYVPNGGKDLAAKLRFLEAMERFAADAQASGRALVLCGDLNVARTDMDVHPKERKAGAIGQLPEERALFERILSHGLVDVGRALDPANEGLFTWWAPWRNLRQRNIGWRIDYVLASAPLAARATRCRVLADFGTSDHAPVVAEFPAAPPSPGAANGASAAS